MEVIGCKPEDKQGDLPEQNPGSEAEFNPIFDIAIIKYDSHDFKVNPSSSVYK